MKTVCMSLCCIAVVFTNRTENCHAMIGFIHVGFSREPCQASVHAADASSPETRALAFIVGIFRGALFRGPLSVSLYVLI